MLNIYEHQYTIIQHSLAGLDAMHIELGIATLAQAIEEESLGFTRPIRQELLEHRRILYKEHKRRIDYAEQVRAKATLDLQEVYVASRKNETEFGKRVGELIEQNFYKEFTEEYKK